MVTRQRKSKDKDKNKSPKVVWRISAAAPLGEYVHSQPDAPADAALAAAAKAKAKASAASADGAPTDLPERGWHHSTHELVHGLDMSEEPIDTLPDELFDQFFKADPPP
jgi:hypothetical protein